MGLGVLEVRADGHVAGTVLLDQEAAHSEGVTSFLKHAHGKDANILLAPQPSEDPNDPLNWAYWKKYFVLFVIGLGAVVNVSAVGACLTAGVVQISLELSESIATINKLSGYMQLAAGASGPVTSAFARKYGKRPVYFFSSALALVGCIVAETATSYSRLIAARVIQGVASTAYESLILASIGDLFFVHERGPLIAFVIFIWTAVTMGVSIIAGNITNRWGWKYNFHILMPFVATQFILIVLLMPETTYKRGGIYNIDTAGSEEDLQTLGAVEQLKREGKPTAQALDLNPSRTNTSRMSSVPQKKSWTQQLAIYNGTFVDDSVLKMIIACPCILLNVGVCWAVFTYGSSVCWSIGSSMLAAVIFTMPPYLLSSAQVGYTSVGALTGALLASLTMGFLSDSIVRRMTHKNRGIFEPEFHLPLGVVGTVITIAGLVSMGHVAEDRKNLYLVCFLWGLQSFGLSVIAISVNGYVLAAFRNYSTEIFMMGMVFRNLVGYGIANVIIDWYMTSGVAQIFDVMSGLVGFFCLLGFPMYVLGKKYRKYWQHHNIIRTMHLETDKTGTEDA